jgi:hypothetical protein
MNKPIPTEGTPEYFDYLWDSYEAEIRLSERNDLRLDSIAFYRDMIRAAYHAFYRNLAAYQQTRERKEAARKVVIEVLGGVAYVKSSPEDIEVNIIDHDNEATSAFDDFLDRADIPQAGDARDEA